MQCFSRALSIAESTPFPYGPPRELAIFIAQCMQYGYTTLRNVLMHRPTFAGMQHLQRRSSGILQKYTRPEYEDSVDQACVLEVLGSCFLHVYSCAQLFSQVAVAVALVVAELLVEVVVAAAAVRPLLPTSTLRMTLHSPPSKHLRNLRDLDVLV